MIVLFRRLFILTLCVCLVSCSLLDSSSSDKPKRVPVELILKLIASENINSDTEGRPTPVLVQVYELKNSALFSKADYFSLQKEPNPLLKEDILQQDELILRPGDRQVIQRTLHSETTAIALVVGYREIGTARWRAVYKLPTTPTAKWYRILPKDKVILLGTLNSNIIQLNPIN